MVRFIGDVHGKWSQYQKLLDCDSSVQVGDFGVGFPVQNGVSVQPDFITGTDHRFIRGNHDSLATCKIQPNWIPDGWTMIQNRTKFMFVGGAWSIDHQYRTPGIDWWDDEELSYYELGDMISKYMKFKPEVMVTHDLPWEVIPVLIRYFSDFHQSRTQVALNEMWKFHKPKLWICGHWHCSVDKEVDGTRFKVLNELEYFDFDKI